MTTPINPLNRSNSMSTIVTTSLKHVVLFRYHGADTWKAGTPADLAAELRDTADKLSDFPKFSKLAEAAAAAVSAGQLDGVLDSLAELKLEVLSFDAADSDHVKVSATAGDVDAVLLEGPKLILQGRDLGEEHLGRRIRVTDFFGATYTGTVQPLKAAGLGHHQFLGIRQDVRAQRLDWVDVIGLDEKVEVFA